jgi:hypothetical protein
MKPSFIRQSNRHPILRGYSLHIILTLFLLLKYYNIKRIKNQRKSEKTRKAEEKSKTRGTPCSKRANRGHTPERKRVEE